MPGFVDKEPIDPVVVDAIEPTQPIATHPIPQQIECDEELENRADATRVAREDLAHHAAELPMCARSYRATRVASARFSNSSSNSICWGMGWVAMG